MRRFKTNALAGLGLLGLVLAQSCGSSGGGSDSSAASSYGPIIKVPVTVSENTSIALKNSTSLGLQLSDYLQLAAPGGVNADSYVMALFGCASGLSASNVATPGSMNVYLHDTGCTGRLTSFVLGGTAFNLTNSGAVAFSPTTYAAGSAATFASSGGALVYVKVVSQLSSPIDTNDVVSYNFTRINAGTNNATVTVSNTQTLYVAGQDAPNFTINSGNITFDSINGSGAGLFTFSLTCVNLTSGEMLTGANVSYKSLCPTVAAGSVGVDVGVNFSYKLIADPNGNGTLTLAQAQSAMSSGDSTVTLSTDILAGNTGFKTASLAGPIPISSNPKMILILQAKNTNPTYTSNTAYSSFQYFALTLPTVTP